MLSSNWSMNLARTKLKWNIHHYKGNMLHAQLSNSTAHFIWNEKLQQHEQSPTQVGQEVSGI